MQQKLMTRKKRIKARSHITILMKRDTMQLSILSLRSQKTIIGPGNLHIADWYYKTWPLYPLLCLI